MDPITHTLVGATLARTGLKERTTLGTATLVVGANIPDIDVVAYFWGGETALWFRRGLTHGVLALLVLPLLLTGLVLLWDRWVRKRREKEKAAAIPSQVLLLATIAVATHPLLDFLNSYGIRFLAPFSYRWFYGDTLFIIDPWVWGMLAIGFWLGRNGRRGPRLALISASLYVALVAASGLAARRAIERAAARDGARVMRVMAAPIAVTPFTRWAVVEDAQGYRAGLFNWLPRPRVQLERLPYDRYASDPVVAEAVQCRRPRMFLTWARFPYYLVQRHGDSYEVYIGDARYTLDPEGSWASTSVSVSSDDQRL